MSNVVRVYCQTEESPSLNEILDWLLNEEIEAAFDEATEELENDDREWESGVIILGNAETAIQLECLRSDGDNAILFEQLCKSHNNTITEVEDAGEVDPIRDHLATTNFIVSLQPLAESEGDSTDMIGLISQTLASNEEGIIEHEGESFIDADGETLLEIE